MEKALLNGEPLDNLMTASPLGPANVKWITSSEIVSASSCPQQNKALKLDSFRGQGKAMPNNALYVIEYSLGNQTRKFIVRSDRMDNAEAWHWAACDAGVAVIPRFGQLAIRQVSRLQAERYGIRDVGWRLTGSR